MIYSANNIKRRYIARLFSTLFIHDVTSIDIILICIVITLVIYQKYIMTLFHDGDVIYDIMTFIICGTVSSNFVFICLH